VKSQHSMSVVEFLDYTSACTEGRKFALAYPTMRAVWDALASGLGDRKWMTWLATRPGLVPVNIIRLAACQIIRTTPLHDGRTVFDLLTDPRSVAAVEAAEKHARGEITDSELAAAYAAADAAAYAAARAADAAADAAAYAAADAAADAAAYAAADAAADAAAYAAADAAAYAAARAAARAAAYAAAYAAAFNIFSAITNPFPE
jgi:hypothetical protein